MNTVSFLLGAAGVLGVSLGLFGLLIWRAPGEIYPGQFDQSDR